MSESKNWHKLFVMLALVGSFGLICFTNVWVGYGV